MVKTMKYWIVWALFS